jgi:hypothetical protein
VAAFVRTINTRTDMGFTTYLDSRISTRALGCLFMFVGIVASFAQTGTVHGTVRDVKTGEPLPFTNVFISNTTIGTSADGQGRFRLTRVPTGPNELVFSFVGYRSIQTKIDLSANQELTLNAQLAPDEELLEAVVVEGKRDKVWEGQVKQFTRSFLGKYISSEDVKIVNPEVLEFREVGPVLFATASDAIQIENNKLGYTIFYFLKKFHSTKGDDYAIIGNARFEEMKTYEPKVAAKWTDNRWEAYQGSMRHLFSSLLKSEARENGFELYNDKTGFENSPRSSFFRAELGKTIESYDTSKMKIVPDASKQLFRILFNTNRVEVHNTKVSSKVRNYDDVIYQVSWLDVRDTTTVDATGRVVDPESVVASGYMSALRIGDQLPNDYQPLNQRSRKARDVNDQYERIYVHTDKEYYYPGERIWFKTYLSRYVGPTAPSLSKTVYVQLINPAGKLAQEKTLRLEGGIAVGDFVLPDTMAAGNYFLRSYTNLQRNFGDENLYSKQLPILKLTSKPVYKRDDETQSSKFIQVVADKPVYKTREKITLRVQLSDGAGNPISGDLSMSVTDASQVIKVDQQGSILDKFPIQKEDIPDAKTVKFRAESGFSIQGQFRNFKGKGEKTDLNFIRFHPSEFFVVETDKHGNFTLQDLQFEGETELSMNSVKGPLAGSVKLLPRDRPLFVVPKTLYTVQLVDDENVQRILTGYDRLQDSKMLEEVVIRGDVDNEFRNKPIEEYNHPYGDVGQYVFGEERIKTQFPNLLYTLQALNISGLMVNPTTNTVYFVRHGKPQLIQAGLPPADPEELGKSYTPQVTLDGVPLVGAAGDVLRMIDPNSVGSLEVTKSQSTIRGSLAPYGVIAVFSKRGVKTNRSDFTSPNFFKVRGFDSSNEFRHPDYQINPESTGPDYRSTLYWNPDVVISGSSGIGELSFFASDLAGTYRVVVEGLNGEGQAVRSLSFVTVK